MFKTAYQEILNYNNNIGSTQGNVWKKTFKKKIIIYTRFLKPTSMFVGFSD